MRILGRHLLVEYAECRNNRLDDEQYLEQVMQEAVRRSGATIVKSVFHRYAPQGVSGVIVIAESHMSIHTWPEYNYASVDFFTCGQTVDPYRAYEYVREQLDSRNSKVTEEKRGIPSPVDELIDHKSMETVSASTNIQ